MRTDTWRAAGLAIAIAGSGPAHAIDGDILTARASIATTFDSNLFRLPDGVALPGGGGRSDAITSLSAGADFERDWSAQVFRVNALVRQNRYSNYSDLDGLDWSGRIAWTLLHGDRSSLDVDVGSSRQTLGFADVRFPGRPVVDTTTASVRGVLELLPRWSAIAGAGLVSTANEPPARSVLDYRLDWIEGGARYDWRTGSVFDLVWRHSRATFSAPIGPLAIDNGYAQDDVGVRMTWQATEATSVSGRAGVQSRSYSDPQRPSFLGPGIRLSSEWRPRGGLLVSSNLRSELSSAAEINASYAQINGFGTLASWQVTGKTSVASGIDLARRDFRGDAALGLTGPQRRDELATVTLGATLRPIRTVELGADLRLERRNSNVDSFDFNARVFALRAGIVF